MGRTIKTNADLRAELTRRGVTVTAVAERMGRSRAWLSTRLATPGSPSPKWLAEVLEHIDALAKDE